MTRLLLTLSILLGLLLTDPQPTRAQTAPQPPDQSLAGVSCPSVTWCMAVGSQSAIQYGVGDVNTRGLAERWDGTTWNEVPLPQSAAAISCTSPTACTAVGSTTAERWDGTAWTVQSVPLPPDSANNPGLSSVSCASATSCVAVGGYTDVLTSGAPPPWHMLIERWNGSIWAIETAPLPSGLWGAMLTNVSCSAPGACTAVGKAPSNTDLINVVERWDGMAWTLEPVPGLDAYPDLILTGISCTSATSCTAVASDYGSPSRTNPVAGQWNGTSWSFQRMPLPPGVYNSRLDALSCATAMSCMAVGVDIPVSGPALNLVERWDGVAWAIVPAAVPAGGAGTLSGVSCASAGACATVGSYWFNSWGRLALTEGWNGSSWSIQGSPATPTSSSLNAISCPSSGQCVAVGSRQDTSGIGVPLAQAWKDGRWTVQSTPAPADALGSNLSAVSCTSPAACTAVGAYIDTDGAWHPLVDRWDGSTWQIEVIPDLGSSYSLSLSSVACPAEKMCFTVGARQAGTTSTPWLELWDGRSWGGEPFPTPANTASASLSAISCSSTSACTAVGSTIDTRGQPLPLVGRWNGMDWTLQRTPPITPAGQPRSFTGISCPTEASCIALGQGMSRTGDYVTMAGRWNGKKWSMHPFPFPTEVMTLISESISCSSASACSAVSLGDSNSGLVPVIDRWNGRRWLMQSVASPTEAAQTQILGTACPSRSACIATGNYIDAAGNQQPLAERWDGRAWAVIPMG